MERKMRERRGGKGLLDRLIEDGKEVDAGGSFEVGLAFDGGEEEQSVDKAFATDRLGVDIIEEAFLGFGRHRFLEEFRGTMDGGEWAFEFVG